MSQAKNLPTISKVLLKDIQPKDILSKLPFEKKKCPLFISSNGNATSLYRYSNSGSFIELSDLLSNNLIPALKFSISKGVFCNINFGSIQDLKEIDTMLTRFKQLCDAVHKDLYNHILRNTLMMQDYSEFMKIIPFDPIHEMVPEIFDNSKQTFRFLFFVQIEDENVSISESMTSLFECIRVEP